MPAWRLFTSSLRLQLRNPVALVYLAAVPLVFLAAFWTLYRQESPPLARHLDELLTITALSGACFALPAWLVSERERGVWRQYRLSPLPPAVQLVAMPAASYVLLLAAAVMQVGVAGLAGTPMPPRILDLWIAFTLASLAFLGLGLLITMLADTVPAAQALGQALFLPMLIVGGVAVSIDALPPWVQAIAASLPGRYAVEAIDGAMAGRGLAALARPAAVLAAMGAASVLAAIAIARWDAGQRLGAKRTLVPAALVIASWIVAGVIVARADTRPVTAPDVADATPVVESAPVPPAPAVAAPPVSALPPAPTSASGSTPVKPPAVPTPPPVPRERTWRDVTMDDVDLNIVFVAVPPDHGVVTPISTEYRRREDVECVRAALPKWPPAGAGDPVQRARNLLLLPAVTDVLQLDIERDLPHAIFDHLQRVRTDELFKVLYWIATHPSEGDLEALDHLAGACLDVTPPDDEDQLRERVAVYATKLLGRITGRIKLP